MRLLFPVCCLRPKLLSPNYRKRKNRHRPVVPVEWAVWAAWITKLSPFPKNPSGRGAGRVFLVSAIGRRARTSASSVEPLPTSPALIVFTSGVGIWYLRFRGSPAKHCFQKALV